MNEKEKEGNEALPTPLFEIMMTYYYRNIKRKNWHSKSISMSSQGRILSNIY